MHYFTKGDGDVLLFLHGYLESSKIWEEFASRFSNSYKVLCIDIPGHGNSEVMGKVHTMGAMAEIAKAILDEECISTVTVFGHSMGGYITMELVSRYPEMIKGYCLFHSTCFADNEEKKLNRDREISLIKCGKKMQIIHTNIPKAFAESNLERMVAEVSAAKKLGTQPPDNGIIALIRGMKERKDHSETLKQTTPPVLLIWGRKDNYIGEEPFQKLTSLAPHASVIVLNESGHMGFLEEPDRAYEEILNWLITRLSIVQNHQLS